MATNDTETAQEEVKDEEVVEETTETEAEDTTDWKSRYEELNRNAGSLKRTLTRTQKELAEAKVKPVEAPRKVELDDTALDYLDLKGITDTDEIEEVRKHMQRTGESLRETLKDDWLIQRLGKIKRDNEAKANTPGSTERAGNAGNNVDYYVARYEQTGKLPDDFKLKSEVVNRLVDRSNTNRPQWHR